VAERPEPERPELEGPVAGRPELERPMVDWMKVC